jgi:hypothetical protein
VIQDEKETLTLMMLAVIDEQHQGAALASSGTNARLSPLSGL